jgi:hypothetical protein
LARVRDVEAIVRGAIAHIRRFGIAPARRKSEPYLSDQRIAERRGVASRSSITCPLFQPQHRLLEAPAPGGVVGCRLTGRDTGRFRLNAAGTVRHCCQLPGHRMTEAAPACRRRRNSASFRTAEHSSDRPQKRSLTIVTRLRPTKDRSLRRSEVGFEIGSARPKARGCRGPIRQSSVLTSGSPKRHPGAEACATEHHRTREEWLPRRGVVRASVTALIPIVPPGRYLVMAVVDPENDVCRRRSGLSARERQQSSTPDRQPDTGGRAKPVARGDHLFEQHE